MSFGHEPTSFPMESYQKRVGVPSQSAVYSWGGQDEPVQSRGSTPIVRGQGLRTHTMVVFRRTVCLTEKITALSKALLLGMVTGFVSLFLEQCPLACTASQGL